MNPENVFEMFRQNRAERIEAFQSEITRHEELFQIDTEKDAPGFHDDDEIDFDNFQL